MKFNNVVHERATLIRDSVFAANDGLVTTFAVVAGSLGASLSSNIVLILGFANLFADGFSMGAGNYLGIKSENEYHEGQKMETHKHSPFLHGLYTFVSFNIAGIIPLLPFLLKSENFNLMFLLSTLLVFLSLFAIGATKAQFSKRNVFKGGVEMLVVGGFAAIFAYVAGFLINKYLIGGKL